MAICQDKPRNGPHVICCRIFLSKAIQLLSKYAHISNGSSGLIDAFRSLFLVSDKSSVPLLTSKIHL